MYRRPLASGYDTDSLDQTCTAGNPPCTCTFCTVNFHCPFCSRKKEIRSQCRFEDEQRAKEAAEQRAKERLEKEKEDRGKADHVAGAAYEFWALMGEVMEELIDGAEPADAFAELAIPSPDSITVTTEFGVHEEPNNYTYITAAGPPIATSAGQEMNEQAATVDLDDMLEHGPALSLGHPIDPNIALALSAALQSVNVVLNDDEIDHLGDDDDADDDDMDAESALIDEFIDDGALTPTTTTTADNN